MELQKEITSQESQPTTLELDFGGAYVAGAMTVGRYFELWLSVFVQPNRSFSTHRQYRQVWNCYLSPVLNAARLSDLTAFECQAALNALHPKVSARTVELARTVLVKALDDAVKQGLLSVNPAKATFRPKVRPPRLRALSPQECGLLLTHLEEDVHDSVIKFLLGTGLRISEALGAKWEDLNNDQTALRVERRLEWLPNGKWRYGLLKTKKSRRLVPVSPLAGEVLKTLVETAANRQGLLFFGSTGNPLWPRNVQRALDAALRRAKLPHVSLHDLRRSFASTLAASGTPVHVLQALLGHESVTTTLNHYANHFQEDLELAVKGLSFGRNEAKISVESRYIALLSEYLGAMYKIGLGLAK